MWTQLKLNFELGLELNFELDFELKLEFDFEHEFEIDLELYLELDFELNLKLNFELKYELKLELVFTVLANKLKYIGGWLRFHYHFSGFNLEGLLPCLQLCHKPFGFLVVSSILTV